MTESVRPHHNRSIRAEAPVPCGCPSPASLGGRKGEDTAGGGAGHLVGAITLSWLYLGPGLLVHPEHLQTRCREQRQRVAGGGRGCGEQLPGFPTTGAVKEKAKISLVFRYDDSSL